MNLQYAINDENDEIDTFLPKDK